ncbi:hypothetical protein BGZ94_001801 [Podila epigama]|nr:hypothetical protein BGZ94_001801 [Podila epigama]
MVERRETGKVYALKYISKAQVIKMDAVRNILRERQILETLDHAFVVNMRFAFQDDEYMYMCMDLMMGGDLRFHTNRKLFGENVVRFWIAELSSAIAHLHSLGIVHRDIKPDNVLLDEQGHAHLTDFNIGCKLTAEKPVLTSQSGTVAYMAPEVFKGAGYGTSVDWWAMGVLFYECIYGKRPFLTDNIADLKLAICNQPIEYPERDDVSPECVSFMREFLNRDPEERLGKRSGMKGIRQHPVFYDAALSCNISLESWWYKLETKQLIPPFKPSSEHNNFDTTYELEDLLLDDDPLTYHSTRKRAQRLRRERDRAIKEENARHKAENEAILLATKEAMEAMNLTIEEELLQQQQRDRNKRMSQMSKLSKKTSMLSLGGRQNAGESGKSVQHSPIQTQPLPMPAQQQQQHHTHPKHQQRQQKEQEQEQEQQQQQYATNPTVSTLSRQTQFQSIPLSPIDGPTSEIAAREFPVPAVPSFRFPPSTLVRYDTNTTDDDDLSTGARRPHIPSSVQPQKQQEQGCEFNSSPTSPLNHTPTSNYPRPSSPGTLRSPLSSTTTFDTKAGLAGEYSYPASRGGDGEQTIGVGAKSKSGVVGLSGVVTVPGLERGVKAGMVARIVESKIPGSKSSIGGDGHGDGVAGMNGETSPISPVYPSQGHQDNLECIHQKQGIGEGGRVQCLCYTKSSDADGNVQGTRPAVGRVFSGSSITAPRPQQVISADYTLSRQQPIPSQQPMLPRAAGSKAMSPMMGLSPGRTRATAAPKAGTMNIIGVAAAAAEATALANMSPEEKYSYQMELIDREFMTFDYTVYESYHGLVDPVTMSVGDPPEWVRNRDQS